MSLPKTYKQASFKEKGGDLVFDQVELKLPGPGEILLKVEACGVCHSDVFPKYDGWGKGFPTVPGHEIIGRVAAVGEGVDNWKINERIGGAWHGGQCGVCDLCKKGLYNFCSPYVVNGVTKDGGYAEYCTIRAQAAIRVPEGVDAAQYAPVLCAGSTVYVALKKANLNPGSTVAVQGLGGLGHMAIQYAKQMGHKVIAISRGTSKEASIRKLGATEYIDSTAGDPGEALVKLGYADLVLSTAMQTDAIAPLVKGVGIYGKLLVVSFPTPGEMTINVNDMMMRGVTLQVIPVGTAHECEEALNFAHLHAIDSEVETFPLDKAQEAFDKMLSGNVRFRSVILP